MRTTRWVQPAFLPGDTPPAPDELEAVLRQSAEAHKIADVEVAGFLSGGVDSAYLTALARPARTYTISYAEPKYDESFPARALARNLGLRNRVRCISPGEFWDAKKKTPRPAFLQSAVPAFRSVSGQFISSRAFFRFCAIWSGQLVLRNPHSVPSRRAMTSSQCR